jgi:hypothetical protein
MPKSSKPVPPENLIPQDSKLKCHRKFALKVYVPDECSHTCMMRRADLGRYSCRGAELRFRSFILSTEHMVEVKPLGECSDDAVRQPAGG